MCGILGMAFQKGNKIKDSKEMITLLKRLLIKSKWRGTDATGVAFVTTTDAAVFKHHIPADSFVETKFFEGAAEKYLNVNGPSRTLIVLGHTRAKTKGCYTNKHNNHPIIADKIIGVHNGVISNDDALFEAFIRRGVKRKAQVDSEIIFRLINYYSSHERVNKIADINIGKAIKSTAKLLTGSYACAAVSAREPWVLWLFKGFGPTYIYHFPKTGLILFASEESFITESISDMGLGRASKIKYENNSCIGINVIENNQTLINFDVDAEHQYY